MIKSFLLWVLKDELDGILSAADNRASTRVDAHREWITQSLAISFKSVNDKIDNVNTLALATSKAFERLDQTVELIDGVLITLESDTDSAFGFVAEKIDDLAMGLDIAFDLIDELEDEG